MTGVLLLTCGLLAASPPPAGPSEADLAAYRAAKSEARRDPEAHVRLALWCEAHGMPAERLKHLGIAVLADPKHAAARGLLGLVAYADRWQSPEDVARRVQADAELSAKLAEYQGRRDQTPNSADAQWDLGLWCEQNGLEAEATAHFTAVTRLEPGREAAWKRLGFKKQGGRWMTEDQIAAAKAEAEAQKEADRLWMARLGRWKSWLGQKSRQAEAEAGLAAVTDARAVPSVLRTFAVGKGADQARATQLLGQIDAPSASRALVLLAIDGATAEVRRLASETLAQRDAREYADLLIGLLRDPIRYEVRKVGGPGSPGELLVEGKSFDRKRVYAPQAAPNLALLPGDRVGTDGFGFPIINRWITPNAHSPWRYAAGTSESEYLGSLFVNWTVTVSTIALI